MQRSIIDISSDDDDAGTGPLDLLADAVLPAAPANILQRREVEFLPDDVEAAAAPVSAAAPPVDLLSSARTSLHSFFAQFAGCRNSAVAVEPVAPDDAGVLDLRSAVPFVALPQQFLDLEAVCMSSDSSGESECSSDSDSHASFIDDSPVALTAADVAVVASFVALKLPLTAEQLRVQPTSPATVTAKKRRRIIVTSSSASPTPGPLSE